MHDESRHVLGAELVEPGAHRRVVRQVGVGLVVRVDVAPGVTVHHVEQVDEVALGGAVEVLVGELNDEWGLRTDHRIVFSKGIHLVVPRLTTKRHHKVLAFFDDEGTLLTTLTRRDAD